MDTASGMYMPKSTFSGLYSTLSGYYGTPPPITHADASLFQHDSCADFFSGGRLSEDKGVFGMGSGMDAVFFGLMGAW